MVEFVIGLNAVICTRDFGPLLSADTLTNLDPRSTHGWGNVLRSVGRRLSVINALTVSVVGDLFFVPERGILMSSPAISASIISFGAIIPVP